LLILAFDGLASVPRRALRDGRPERTPSQQPAGCGRAQGGHQQAETQRIGEEPGDEQENRCEHQQPALQQLLRRKLALTQHALHALPVSHPLEAKQPQAQGRSEHNQRHGHQSAHRVAHPRKPEDFQQDDGDEDDQGQKGTQHQELLGHWTIAPPARPRCRANARGNRNFRIPEDVYNNLHHTDMQERDMRVAVARILRRWSLVALMLAPVALMGATDPRNPYAYFFQPTFGDFQEDLEEARAEGKKAILIFFEMDECPFCHRMKQQVLNQPEVQDYFREHFAIFSVDVEGDLEVTDFQGNTLKQSDFAFRENRVRATPVFQFFNLDGEPIARFTGATRDVREFLQLGEYVAEGHYQSMNFTRFKREAP
jgi:thioredoxin-related protein